MLNSSGGELIPADPEIEHTFHQLQRETREAQQHQIANEQENSIVPANEDEVVEKETCLWGIS